MTAYNSNGSPEPDLDPADWEAYRASAHRLLDDLVDRLAGIRERAPWRSVPDDVRARIEGPLPASAQGLEAALEDLRRDVLPYPYGTIHPRFWGWVNGSGLPVGMLADLAATAMNPNVGAFDHAAVFVEEAVLRWLREMLAYEGGDGILTSGGSMANLLGVAAAVRHRAGFDVRRSGLAGGPRLVVYGSRETHNSIQKAVELCGLGSDQLRLVAVGPDHRVDVAALADAVRADRAAGRRPIAVVGNAGTVNTGATDDLEALADLAAEEELWLHLDGAFGALAWLAPEARPQLAGMQRADSIAFDLHKWLYLSNDVGCLLVRDPDALTATFALEAPYLVPMEGGLAVEKSVPFKDRGIELTRRFRALKVWLALKEHGVEGFAGAIASNLAQAAHLAARVEASEELELVAPVPLNVVCFRYAPAGFTGDLDDLNRRLLVRLQEDGVAVPSHTILGGAFALRVAITNHRTRLADLDHLAEESARIGRELTEKDASTTR